MSTPALILACALVGLLGYAVLATMHWSLSWIVVVARALGVR